MYLSKLDLNEKKSFLNLAAILAESNGIVEESEKFMLDMYCAEMQIEGELEDKSFEENIEALRSSSPEAKNIIVFELIGLCLTDGGYDDDEKDNMKQIATELGVSADKLAELEKDMADYYELVKKMSVHVFSN
ncbi:MAG: hypothetical protein J5840_03735 [Lachnospiraceae bacterium]|nr:hypothetical protein [Lachnospiraceae bacterium]